MKDCNNILIYKEERERMCKGTLCSDCGLNSNTCNKIDVLTLEHVAIVQKWSNEHPVKTIQSELLKIYPNMKIENGVINMCPMYMDVTFKCNSFKTLCVDCKKEFWSREVK